MRVRELRLKNFRPFADPAPFLFSEQFTVIAGVNGRGKTALLDGLALLLSRLLPLVSPARSGYKSIIDRDIHKLADETRLFMKVNCVGHPIDYELVYTRENNKVSTTKLSKKLRDAVQREYGDPTRLDDAAPLVVYYTTDRAGYRLPKKLPSDVPRGQAAAYAGALFNRTINFRDFMARYRAKVVLENEQRLENPAYLGSVAVKVISNALCGFLDGFTNLRVQEQPLRLLIDKAGHSLDLTQLSDGERSFLALVCDLGRRLALANPELDNPLKGAGVVLIDELELHLHPKWQREVAEKLRSTFPNIQFIVTTHSPFVIQSLRSGELINLDPEEFAEYADKSIEDIAENVMGVDLPQKSERYLHMMETAERYYKLLRSKKPESLQEAALLKQELDKLAEPFSDDPAYMALLRLERETWLGGQTDAPR